MVSTVATNNRLDPLTIGRRLSKAQWNALPVFGETISPNTWGKWGPQRRTLEALVRRGLVVAIDGYHFALTPLGVKVVDAVEADEQILSEEEAAAQMQIDNDNSRVVDTRLYGVLRLDEVVLTDEQYEPLTLESARQIAARFKGQVVSSLVEWVPED